MTDDEVRGLDHAWRYFSLHAEQRMTVFNFYVASAGLALTGLAWTLAEGSERWPLGAAAGVSAAALSFLFWRLDQRGAQFVKTAEDAMATLERGMPTSAAVTIAERRLTTNRNWYSPSVPWTFGRSFRLLFAVVALLGLAGAMLTTFVGVLAADKVSRTGARHSAGRRDGQRIHTAPVGAPAIPPSVDALVASPVAHSNLPAAAVPATIGIAHASKPLNAHDQRH